MPEATIQVLQSGDPKPDPFTICIVANPALEVPWQSGRFVADTMPADPLLFQQRCQYIIDCLFGRLVGQSEALLADPRIGVRVRIVSVLDPGLAAEDANSLVAEHPFSTLLVPRRNAFRPFLSRYGLVADVAYAVSKSQDHVRASAFFTTDDDTGPGVPFQFNGSSFWHRYRCLVPGTIALHATSASLTALHEFGHALSSYSNGSIVDLYVDSNPAINCERGRPIPISFGIYSTTTLATDPTRGGLGYPTGWLSYHCELNATAVPAVMDNYFQSPTVPEACEHDKVTRQFLVDRLLAKIGR